MSNMPGRDKNMVEMPTMTKRDMVLGGMVVAALVYATPWLSKRTGFSLKDQEKFIDALSEALLPGSAAASPGPFLAAMLPRGLFALTLESVRRVSHALNLSAQGDFITIAPARRHAALAALDAEAFAGTAGAEVADAWKKLKTALLSLYYSSEKGAAHDLLYEPVFGHWEPDIPLSSQPVAYSTDMYARRYT